MTTERLNGERLEEIWQEVKDACNPGLLGDWLFYLGLRSEIKALIEEVKEARAKRCKWCGSERTRIVHERNCPEAIADRDI